MSCLIIAVNMYTKRLIFLKKNHTFIWFMGNSYGANCDYAMHCGRCCPHYMCQWLRCCFFSSFKVMVLTAGAARPTRWLMLWSGGMMGNDVCQWNGCVFNWLILKPSVLWLMEGRFGCPVHSAGWAFSLSLSLSVSLSLSFSPLCLPPLSPFSLNFLVSSLIHMLGSVLIFHQNDLLFASCLMILLLIKVCSSVSWWQRYKYKQIHGQITT